MKKIISTIRTGTPILATLGLFALASLSLVSLSGCNTTEGVGKDIKATGEAIEDAADDN